MLLTIIIIIYLFPQVTMSRQGWTKTSVLELNHNHRNVIQGAATASTLRGTMSRQGWTKTSVLELNHNHRNVIQGAATASTLRGFHHLYNIFKQDTTTTGMSIKGQQLRLHYEDFTTYIITLNWTPQPQECQSRDSNCVYTTRISPPIYSNF